MDSYFSSLAAVNPWAALTSALAMIVVATLWYSPLMFQRTWVRHSGIRPNDIRPGEMRRNYVLFIVATLIAAYLLGLVATHAGGSIFALGFSVGFVWLFITLEQFNRVLWERDTVSLFLLQSFRSLFSLLAGAAVFLIWS